MRRRRRLPPEHKCRHCSYSSTSYEDVEAHRQAKHRAHCILDRIRTVEQCAKWAGEDADWKTDPHAIEYRALMREWWTLPNDQVQEALRLDPIYPRPTYLLTAKGPMHVGVPSLPTRGTIPWLRALDKAAKQPEFTFALVKGVVL